MFPRPAPGSGRRRTLRRVPRRPVGHATGLLTVGAEDAEHVIVARRGVVASDGRVEVDASGPTSDVDASADALAIAEAAGAGPAVRLVAGDRAADDGEDRMRVREDAAPQAVAALGLVIGDEAIDHGGADTSGGE